MWCLINIDCEPKMIEPQIHLLIIMECLWYAEPLTYFLTYSYQRPRKEMPLLLPVYEWGSWICKTCKDHLGHEQEKQDLEPVSIIPDLISEVLCILPQFSYHFPEWEEILLQRSCRVMSVFLGREEVDKEC